jgi:ABC-type sugar transport system ATPase subunit
MHENGSRGGPERDGPLLSARGIDKSFGAVQALKSVDFEVRTGEVVALIGDNGAGKSTMINVITGVFPPDSGEIVFEGERVEFASPHDARERGIEAVYQDLAVAPQLDAVANIFLGRERRMRGLLGWFGFLDQQRMRKETEEQLEELRVRIPDLTKRLSTFSGGQRQGVAVARAVMWPARLSSWMSPRRLWVLPRPGWSSTSSGGCARPGSRWCSSATTCRRSSTSPTEWSSCGWERWSRS